MNGLRVAILGATGAVGQEFLGLFEDRKFPVSKLKLLASARSAGKRIEFRGESHQVEAVSTDSFDGIDLCFFSAGASRSKEFAPIALAKGATVIDNSSAFRMNPDVPLLVPEINPEAAGSAKLFSVGNCTAIILCMAIAPLQKLGSIESLVVSTYQSVSGAGASAIEELIQQTSSVLKNEHFEPTVFPHPCAFNVFSHNTEINDSGYNEEEWKVIQETRKILSSPELKINVTCVRVPVLRAHTESVAVEFSTNAPSIEAVRSIYENSPGIKLVDDRDANHFPMPVEASKQYDVLVGRLRHDSCNPKVLNLLVCGDQLLKGAALNAVQIAEYLLASGRDLKNSNS